MSIGLLFWLLFIVGALLAFIFGLTGKINVVEIFILVQVALLGWKVFGFPIQRGGLATPEGAR